MDNTQTFVEEIDFSELDFIEIVGRGAFGVVSRARWKGIDVAVKHIETASERKAFATELKQLSRVSHPNIVTLYGACTKQPVCLVMEYAEGGSLYSVLHGTGPQIDYTMAHALSWCLQCAQGVEYLHGMKPKALIHRDLKPPNLLLVRNGTLLKICDFGTACDLHTYMTNNKGSAAWMAPEVFEGSNYSEKCDVFSWGIILWEVLTRRKPFEEIGGPAFRIMWAVHNGTRPPLIANCPKAIEILMTKCWSSKPVERPAVCEIVRVMSRIFQYVKGADEPLVYADVPETPPSALYDTPPPTYKTSTRIDLHDTVKRAGEPVPLYPVTQTPKPVVVEETTSPRQRMTSAPASLAASRESLLEKGGNSSRSSTPSVENMYNKRYSADLTRLEQYEIMSQGGANKSPADSYNSRSDSELDAARGHRRTGSYGSPYQVSGPVHNMPPQARGHQRTLSCGSTYQVLPGSVYNMPLQARGHRRTLSCGSTYQVLPGPVYNTPPQTRSHRRTLSCSYPYQGSSGPVYNMPPQGRGHRRTGSHGNSPLTSDIIISPPVSGAVSMPHVTTAPGNLSTSLHLQDGSNIPHAIRSVSWTPGLPSKPAPYDPNQLTTENVALNLQFNALDHQLQPLAPCTTSPESMHIYQEHVNMAQEYMRVQMEIGLLTQRKKELKQELQQDEKEHENSTRFIEEYAQLVAENEQLMKFYNNLKKQVEMLRQQQVPPRGHSVT